MKTPFALVLLLFFSLTLRAQDLNGVWKGTLTISNGCFPENHIELQVTIRDDSVFGNSYHYLNINYYVKKKFRGVYNRALKKIIVEEGILLTYNIPKDCQVCMKTYELSYSSKGNEEVLAGGWNGYILGKKVLCEPGTITLSRIKESAFSQIPEISVDSGDIRLDFYDNGIVDGDSITVLVNKRVVLSNQKLSVKPITTMIRVDLYNTFQEIEMVANNLGSIPPNTALLIITAGRKRYRLFLTSTNARNAVVRFVYDKEYKDVL